MVQVCPSPLEFPEVLELQALQQDQLDRLCPKPGHHPPHHLHPPPGVKTAVSSTVMVRFHPTFAPSGPGDPGLPLAPCRPVGPFSPLSPGGPRSPCCTNKGINEAL